MAAVKVIASLCIVFSFAPPVSTPFTRRRWSRSDVALGGEDGLGAFGSQQRIDVEMWQQTFAQLVNRIRLGQHF